jgi:hypothetical protein
VTSERIDENKHYWEALAPDYMRVVKAEMERFWTYNGRYPKSDQDWTVVWASVNGG